MKSLADTDQALPLHTGHAPRAAEILDWTRGLDACRDCSIEAAQVLSALDEHAIVAITDAQGTILYANDTFVTLSKYPREELVGQNHRLINSGYHPKEFFASMWKTIAAGKVWKGEIKNRAKDGTFYWVSNTIVPYMDADGQPTHYISIRTDITARKKLESDLLVSLEATRLANRAKSEFLSMISHEIRTPLNGIIGMTELALSTALTDEQRDYLNDAYTCAQSLHRLIKNILDFSSLNQTPIAADAMDFDLHKLVSSVLDEYRPDAVRKNLGLALYYRKNTPDQMNGDPVLIRRVLEHLVENAIKFTETGGVRISIERAVLVGSENGQRGIEIAVEDSGVGIPPEKQASVFEPFFQADPSTTRRYCGSGIGLAICRKLAENLRGSLTFTSSLRHGSTFRFTLPFVPIAGETDVIPGGATAERVAAHPKRSGRTRAPLLVNGRESSS